MTLAVTWHILGQTEVIFTTCRIVDREEQVTCLKRADLSLCYRNHKRNLSVHRIWIYMWRLKVVCSKHTQVFCLHAIHLKQLFSWNTLVQFWFPTDNQGRSHMTAWDTKELIFNHSINKTTMTCVFLSLCDEVQYHTVQEKYMTMKPLIQTGLRITQTQPVIYSPIITPCRISWKHMHIIIDPKTTRIKQG